MSQQSVSANFVIVEPARSCCDFYGRVLDRAGLLRLLTVGTRRGVNGISMQRTRLKPAIGLVVYAAGRTLSTYRSEAVRFALHSWIDRWSKKFLQPGDHILSSYGYANECFKWARQHGGKTLLDGGNSHPENFWTIISEELRRWKSPYNPVARYHYRRSLAMMEHVDYVLSPSSFVANSFITRGFDPAKVFINPYPVDLSCFTPSTTPRPKDRPLTIVSTGRLSLRKGTPYLLEAFQLLRQKHPSARLLLTSGVENNIRPVLEKYRDLPVEWAPNLPHSQLAERLRSADIFVLPSLEDGFALTVTEAMACGLPVIITPNTGASDLVTPGENGEIVPICNAVAIHDAILKWAERVMSGSFAGLKSFDPSVVSLERFAQRHLEQLKQAGLINEIPSLAIA
jgi:alpha-maltose-1-phosphate synthase